MNDDDDEPRTPVSSDDDASEHMDEGFPGDPADENLDGPVDAEGADPAYQAVIEAGGGVAEGFEQSEAALVQHATDPDELGTKHILDDAGEPEDPERTTYGEADSEHSSEMKD